MNTEIPYMLRPVDAVYVKNKKKKDNVGQALRKKRRNRAKNKVAGKSRVLNIQRGRLASR